MEYEVVIRVKTTGTNSDELYSLRQIWSFGDNPKWILAGQMHVIEETARDAIDRIHDRMLGSNDQVHLDINSGRPIRK